jgi:hypothetical protein
MSTPTNKVHSKNEKKTPIAFQETANGGHFHAFRICCNTSAVKHILHG